MTDLTPEFPENDVADLIDEIDGAGGGDSNASELTASEETSLGLAASEAPIFDSNSGGGSF